jgi:hypothetical protein
VFGRLAGYEDVNDAERLCFDPAIRNLARPAERIVAFCNQRGTAEQWINEGKSALKWTRLSCRTFAAAARLQLHAIALQPRQLHAHAGVAEDVAAVVADQPAREADQDRRQVVSHGRYVTFWMLTSCG